ncbi:DNA-binding protein [bacterium]|nr:DNA-binding protein [Planctomicrobium sp.]MDA7527520.1 DNA-binding protein [bacterium]
MTNEISKLLEQPRAEKLHKLADRSGIPADELIRRAVDDLLQKADNDITDLAQRIARKNAELYERLS